MFNTLIGVTGGAVGLLAPLPSSKINLQEKYVLCRFVYKASPPPFKLLVMK